MERKDDQSVPLTFKKIYEPLFSFLFITTADAALTSRFRSG